MRRVVPPALVVFYLVGMAVAGAFAAATPDSGNTDWGVSGTVGLLLLGVPGAAFTAVGALVALRRPENRVGALCLGIGALWTLLLLVSAVGSWLTGTDRAVGRAAEWVSWPGAWFWVLPLGLMLTHLPLRLPDGRLPSPGWRWLSRLSTVAIAVAAVGIAIAPADPGVTPNPIGQELVGDLAPLLLAPVAVAVIGSLTAIVRRYRRSADVRERLQLRCIAFGAAIFVGSYLGCVALLFGFGLRQGGEAAGIATEAATVAYSAIPVAIGVAILRHRLYEIDRVINRTLVYASVTVLLACCYAGLVLLLRAALGPLTEGNGLAVAISTLAVAAMFQPLRRRVQDLVDRRFYRSRYDAARTLESFSARLQAQTDLDALRADLAEVVRDAMQPAHVSVWLRPVTAPVTISGRPRDTTEAR